MYSFEVICPEPQDFPKHWRYELDVLRASSTCAKLSIAAIIIKNDFTIARGYNKCAPEGYQYGQPVKECPRNSLPSGAGYELCKPLHAEQQAIKQAKTIFGEDACIGATIVLGGHYYACPACSEAIDKAGIAKLVFDPETAAKAREFYKLS